METKKITVVMSVFNAEDYLKDAVESILNQSYSNFKFIIFEDASTDNSLQILEDFEEKDQRIKLIKNTENQGSKGFIINLNRGLEMADTEFIARMDADDISAPDRFEKQLDYLEKNKNIFMVGSDLQLIDREGNNTKLLLALSSDDHIKKNMLKNISMYHPVLLFRNDKKIRYREKMQYCEDYDLYLQMMTENYSFGNINEPLLKYRVLDTSMSRQQDKVIKNLFVNKAKELYKERLEKGQDSYDSFNPGEYLNIYKNPSKNLVKKSITVSKKYYDYNGFSKMMGIYKNIGKDVFYYKNRMLLILGKKIFFLNAKILNKLSQS
ncbi:glycosyltransferase [Chryseobacterium wangxinyae]|uniref:glycosyltransferase family 2 protein n=1 Tax=Chryseobacterium sp. CY350 TaxID=2997336 RepID=UPI002271A2A6|nr:glycosyltransferase [Chryseobacterium sp. CY350]MCY0975840.1 glycosyltransferase [Chryseobacterium sp. CY350]WBZ94551.1 glycosyltransferase [Chryseobacterium sp. CY350]